MIARGSRYPWWLWPNILSLDAPVVTLVWQMWFAKCFQVNLATQYYWILFLTVWLIYALDRWLDGWKLDISKPHLRRHRFYRDYRWPLLAVWLLVLMQALLILPSLSRVVMVRGLMVSLGCVVYLLLVHKQVQGLPKEVLVGIMVSLGVTLCFWQAGWPLVIPAVMLAWLVTLNCLVIGQAEAPFDRAQQLESMTSHMDKRAWRIVFVTGFPAFILAWHHTIYLPMVLAFLGLWGLYRFQDRLAPALKRVLADVVLLIPFFFM